MPYHSLFPVLPVDQDGSALDPIPFLQSPKANYYQPLNKSGTASFKRDLQAKAAANRVKVKAGAC